MATKNMIRIICAVLIVCFAVCGLAACGDADKKSDDKVKITINDDGKKTEVEIEEGKTVADALAAAKITLGDSDTCSPKTDEKITKDTKEITVTRVAATEAPTEAPTAAPTAAPTQAPKTEAPTEAATEAPQSDDGGNDNGYDDGGDQGNYDDGGDQGDQGDQGDGGVYEVDRVAMPDCDGSGHGYYIITYSDGSTGTEEY